MASTMKMASLLLILVLIHLVAAKFSEVPPPPKRPERFHSREELKQYLQKVHEYHSIVGRWRLRRESNDLFSHQISTGDLFKFFDINNDHIISKSEFDQRLNSPHSEE